MSTPLSFRVTCLEQFRQTMYCDIEDKPWLTEENLIDTIKGIERPNVKADFGTFGHEIIENPEKHIRNGWNTQGFPHTTFANLDFKLSLEQVQPLLNFRAEHPLMTREIPLSKLYHVNGYDIILTGTTDHLEGEVMRDTKFKFSSFDVQDFIDSIQYKAYLHMLGMKYFVYDFFNVRGFETIADCYKARISEVESMPLVWNDSFENDLYTLMGEFMEYVLHKGLIEYLKIDQKKANKIAAGGINLKTLMV